jgi:hypothetical protein
VCFFSLYIYIFFFFCCVPVVAGSNVYMFGRISVLYTVVDSLYTQFGLRKTTQNLIHNSRCPCQNSDEYNLSTSLERYHYTTLLSLNDWILLLHILEAMEQTIIESLKIARRKNRSRKCPHKKIMWQLQTITDLIHKGNNNIISIIYLFVCFFDVFASLLNSPEAKYTQYDNYVAELRP